LREKTVKKYSKHVSNITNWMKEETLTRHGMQDTMKENHQKT
jgi:hypothetical protein